MANSESSAFGALKESWLLLSPFWRVLTVLFFILMFWIGPVLRDGISSGMDYAGKSIRSWWEKPAPSSLEEAAREGNITYTADKDDRIAELMRKNIECIKSMSGEYRSTRAFKLGNQPYTIAFLVCNSGDIYYEISPRPDFSSSAIDFIDFRTLQAPLERQQAGDAPAAATSATPAAANTPPAAPRVIAAAILPLVAQGPAAGGMTPIPAQFQINIICQRPVGDNRGIFRRIQTPQGCFDQIIDSWNGMIVRSQAAPCAPC